MKKHWTNVVAALLFTAIVPSLLFAETAAERWGRAQTQYNSYEANHQSRERNKPGYSNMGTPQKTSESTYDSTPRSGSVISEEHEAKMQAMRQKWADFEAEQARRREMKEEKERQDHQEFLRKYEDAEAKKYAKLWKKAIPMAFKSDEEWTAFKKGMTAEDREVLRNGRGSMACRYSPFADTALQILSGARKPIKGTAVDSARKIYERGVDNWDFWSVWFLGELEIRTDPVNGEAKRAALYDRMVGNYEEESHKINMGRERIVVSNGYWRVLYQTIRILAFGWGVPVNKEKAEKYYSTFSGAYYGVLGFKPEFRELGQRKEWIDAQILRAELTSIGIEGGPPDLKGSRWYLKSAFDVVIPNDGDFDLEDKTSMLMTLLGFEGDLDNKSYSAALLKKALDAGHIYVGGEYVCKLLKCGSQELR